MIAVAAAIAAAAGSLYAGTRGIPVRSGQLGAPGLGPRWRVRWAVWRWKAQVWTARGGWRGVGEFKSEELARGAAIAKAMEYAGQPGILEAGPTISIAQSSFKRGDV